ncbi:MAG TPA: GNAT family protein [Nocardioides sp.]|jgi:RimJ/RimL family protein N-acetyltransferase|nr:GNAT family protein [Nocardioides sp.]
MPRDLSAVAWPVRTERLTIRPATLDDADATWQIRRIESVGRWLSAATGERDDFRRKFAEPERLSRTLLMELGGAVIGDLYVAVGDAWAQTEVAERARGVQAEIGWVLAPDHEGRGYATEAVTEVLRICFEDLGLRRVFAQCFADNEPSWRLMERVGMRREEHAVRESLHRSGEWLDGLRYALLADEWRPARARPAT